MTKLRTIFAVACVGTAIPNMDLFSTNIALPEIAKDFTDVPIQDLTWVINGYAIAFAALLLFFGRLSEGYRRDRSFLLGVTIFTLAAAASTFAGSLWELVAYRVVAGAGAALMTPTSIGLILATFPPSGRAAAVRNWAGIGGLAAAMGPVVGGALVSVDWRFVFATNALLGAVSVLLGLRYLPNVSGHAAKAPSILSAFLVTSGIACLIFALVKGNAWGWTSPAVAGSVLGSLLLLAAFLLHTLRSSNPLIDPKLFLIPTFKGASLAIIPYSISFGAMLFSISIWGQTAWGWSALQAGFSIIVGPLMVPLTATFVTGRLIGRYGVIFPIKLGIALIIAGFCLWAIFMSEASNAILVVFGMLLNGVGVGLIFPALMGAGTQDLPPSSYGTGSGAINMLRQASIAIGVAVFVAIIGSPETLHNRLTAFQLGWWFLALVTAVTLVPAIKFLR
ncbi:MFS transporter [Sulfitobacter sp. BDSS02]|nr:MFS transporter [Sulfitobacter sp. BDSS02]MBR9851969.1 MFS transporter [Paracoccaceae bacterium]